MSDHEETAKKITQAWGPQTTLGKSRRDIADAIAAAEERGRRRGVEERERLLVLIYDMAILPLDFPQRINERIRAVLAPRDSGKGEVCRAEVASRMPDYSHYECTLPKGHTGAHREGGTEWTDKDTVIP